MQFLVRAHHIFALVRESPKSLSTAHTQLTVSCDGYLLATVASMTSTAVSAL